MVENIIDIAKLSIRKSVDSFVFFSQNENLSISKGTMTSSALFSSEISDKNFISSSTRAFLVPIPFYTEETKVDLVKSQLDYDESIDDIYTFNIESIGSICIYVVNKLEHKDYNHFNQVHDVVFFIKYLEEYIKDNSTKEVVLFNVIDNAIQITAFNNGEFQFFNTFPTASKTDFLYFLMLVTKQIGFDEKQCQILISGDIDSTSPIIVEVNQYFNQVIMAPQLDIQENIIGMPFDSRDIVLWASML